MPSEKIRAVLDTNIFVAAFKKPGGLSSLIIKEDWAMGGRQKFSPLSSSYFIQLLEKHIAIIVFNHPLSNGFQ